MKAITILTLGLVTFASTALAQTTTGSAMSYGATTGAREFTIGGAGATNTDFDNSFGALNFSLGTYISDMMMWSIRQSIQYSNPQGGDQDWNGATRLAFDYHLASRERLRPFIGVNFGGFYGENTSDTWAAGLEAGVKHYVQQRTFIFAMAEYAWYFNRVRNLNNNFDDGEFNWSIGMGINF